MITFFILNTLFNHYINLFIKNIFNFISLLNSLFLIFIYTIIVIYLNLFHIKKILTNFHFNIIIILIIKFIFIIRYFFIILIINI